MKSNRKVDHSTTNKNRDWDIHTMTSNYLKYYSRIRFNTQSFQKGGVKEMHLILFDFIVVRFINTFFFKEPKYES